MITWWVFKIFTCLCAAWQSSHTKSPQSRQYPVAIPSSQLPHCVSVDSTALLKASRISNKWSIWKSDCSPETPFADNGTRYLQVGHWSDCPSLATSFSRHGDLQNTWKQGNSFGSLKLSRQREHSSCESSFFRASFVVLFSAMIVKCSTEVSVRVWLIYAQQMF